MTPKNRNWFSERVMLTTVFGVGAALMTGLVTAGPAAGQTFNNERDIGAIRLGQKVLVDDGSCPAGQVKEVSGARLVADGVEVSRQCVPRKVRR